MEAPKIAPDLLEILRCPVGVRMQGDNPGALSLERNGWWLVCAESGYKYPVRAAGPDMLPEVGEQWSETPVDELPVPPPSQ